MTGKSIANLGSPSSLEIEMVLMALAGKSMKEVMDAKEVTDQAVLAGLKRVRDAIRSGEIPEQIASEFPEFVKWQGKDFGHHKNGNGSALAIPVMSADLDKALSAITDETIPDPDPDKAESLAEYLRRVKVKAARAVPFAFRALLEEAVGSGDYRALNSVLDRFYGNNRGMMIAQKFEFNQQSKKGSSDTPSAMRFEEIVGELDREDARQEWKGSDTAELEDLPESADEAEKDK